MRLQDFASSKDIMVCSIDKEYYIGKSSIECSDYSRMVWIEFLHN